MKKIKFIAVFFAIIYLLIAGCSSGENASQNEVRNISDENKTINNIEKNNSESNDLIKNRDYTCEFMQNDSESEQYRTKLFYKNEMIRIDDMDKEKTILIVKDNLTYMHLDEESKMDFAQLGMQDCEWIFIKSDSDTTNSFLQDFDMTTQILEYVNNESFQKEYVNNENFQIDCDKSTLSENLFEIEGKICDFTKIINDMMKQYADMYNQTN